MEELTNVSTTEETSTTEVEAPKVESTAENINEPYKIYNTEDDFNKEIKSNSQKRIAELYKELGVESKEQIKEALEIKGKYDELFNTYETLSKEYSDYKTKNSEIIATNEKLSRDLVLTQLNISTDEQTREDFITSVEALAQKREITFEDAAKEYLERHPDFIENKFLNNLKIGGEKSATKPNSNSYTKEELIRFPFLRNN